MTLFVLGLVLSIPVAVVANLCTPWVRTIYATRGAARKRKRIKRIKKDLKRVGHYRNCPANELTAYVATRIIRVVGNFCFPVIFLGAALFVKELSSTSKSGPVSFSLSAEVAVMLILSIISLFAAVFNGLNARRFFRSIYSFDSYRKDLEAQLERLGTSVSQISSTPDETADSDETAAPDETVNEEHSGTTSKG